MMLAGYKKNQKKLYMYGFKGFKSAWELRRMKEKTKINMPLSRSRIGLVKVTKWENESSDGGKFVTFSIQNSYYDKKEASYKETSSYSVTDLMKLRSLIDRELAEEIKLDETEKVIIQSRPAL